MSEDFLIRIGRADPETKVVRNDDGSKTIIMPYETFNLMRWPFFDLPISNKPMQISMTYHRWSSEVWLSDRAISDLDDWKSIMNLAITLKLDHRIGIRIRGTNTRKKDHWQRFDFEILGDGEGE